MNERGGMEGGDGRGVEVSPPQGTAGYEGGKGKE